MNEILDINIAFAAFCFIISVIILISVITSEHGKEKSSRLFTYIIFANLMLLLSNAVWFLLNGNPDINSPVPVIITEYIKASCGPVIMILFTRLVVATLSKKTAISKYVLYAARIAVALCIVDIISIIIEPLIFSSVLVGENNQLVRPDWYLLSYVFTFVCIAINSGILIAKRKFLKVRELLTLVAYIIIPALGVIVHILVEGTPINMVSITVAIVFYFAMIQNDLSKQTHELERELVESKISVMMSQIKPHFLHNALSAIVQLCDENPEQAKSAAIDFSLYLRGNMESLSNNNLISIEKEIDHVIHYLNLEKAIYGKSLEIIYNIDTGGFLVPPLTIQPIVENAVKHGIGKKEDGGTITITVSETEEIYLITVTDNGAGYDMNNSLKNKDEQIGVDNVRKRLALCGGTLEISGKVDKGTTAAIALPK